MINISRKLIQLLVVLITCLSAPLVSAQQPLDLARHSGDSTELTPFFAVLEDASNALTLADVESPEQSSKFVIPEAKQTSLIFGFTRSAYWLRLNIKNDTSFPVERIIDINSARLSEVSFFQLVPNATPISYITGTNYPFSSRPYANRVFVFPITIPANTEQTVYLRVKGIASLEIPARIWKPKAFNAYERNDYVGYSVYSGMALAMVIFNALVFALLRESMYLMYVFFVGCFAVTLAAQNGLANEFLWPNSPKWTVYSLATGYSLTLAALMMFTRRMLNTQAVIPRVDKIATGFGIAFLLMPVTFLINYGAFVPIAMLLNVAGSSLILGIGIYCAWKRQRSAYFFVAAFLVICLSSPINSLRVAGVLPTNFFTANCLQIGSAIEMILLAYALADRLYTSRKEKELAQAELLHAQQQLVDNLQASERKLEDLVERRTHELLIKNHELEHLSVTDQLTGIYNRLKLHHRLSDELERCKRYNTRFSLLMIDVDHFKSINDHYGHDSGDQVLKAIADTLVSNSRINDVAGRWGGEEFLMIMPETDIQGAKTLAEELRKAISELTFTDNFNVTVSIGVTQATDADTIKTIFNRADKALYAAKNAGRNRIIEINDHS